MELRAGVVTPSKKKRYHLVLPQELYDEVESLAERHGTTVVEILRRFVKLGLVATRIENDPNSKLIVREGGEDRELMLLI